MEAEAPQDDLHRLDQIPGLEIGLRLPGAPRCRMVLGNPNRPHPRGAPALDIRDPVPDHPAILQRKPESLPGLKKEIGRRLAASAIPRISGDNALRMVVAVVHSGKLHTGGRQLDHQPRVDPRQLLQAALALGVVRLVRNQHQRKPGLAQGQQRGGRTRRELELGRGPRRAIVSRLRVKHIAVDHPVTIQEHRRPPVHVSDSHFISWSFSPGCDTMQCQMAAWKASVCGVTVSAEIVGTTSTSSPTCAA